MARTEPELTDAQWAALAPLLPPQRPATGWPNNDHRQVVEAMVWLARTGAPWRDLPAHYGWMAERSSEPALRGGRGGVGHANSPASWPGTRAARSRERGGCYATAASPR